MVRGPFHLGFWFYVVYCHQKVYVGSISALQDSSFVVEWGPGRSIPKAKSLGINPKP